MIWAEIVAVSETKKRLPPSVALVRCTFDASSAKCKVICKNTNTSITLHQKAYIWKTENLSPQ